MSSEALLPPFRTGYTPADDWESKNAYNKKEVLAGTPLRSVTEILIQHAPIQMQKAEAILKMYTVFRLPFA